MLNILIGTWLLVAPFVFGVPAALFWTMLLLGLALIIAEALTFWQPKLRYAATAVGALLILSSFTMALGNNRVFWNNFLFGMAAVVLSLAVGTQVKSGPWVPHRRRNAEVH